MIIFSALNHVGINGVEDYRNGDWFGNSLMDGPTIFNSATYTLSNLVENISVHYQNGDVSESDEEMKTFETRMIQTVHFGRCYDIKFEKRKQNIEYVDVRSKQKIVIIFNLPGQFYTSSRSYIQSNTGESKYVEVSYEVLKNNHGLSYKNYSYFVSKSYDKCKATNLHEKIHTELNCTMPFVIKTGQVINNLICRFQ